MLDENTWKSPNPLLTILNAGKDAAGQSALMSAGMSAGHHAFGAIHGVTHAAGNGTPHPLAEGSGPIPKAEDASAGRGQRAHPDGESEPTGRWKRPVGEGSGPVGVDDQPTGRWERPGEGPISDGVPVPTRPDGVPEPIHDGPQPPVIEESPPGGFEPTTSEPPAEESGPVPVQDEIDVDKLDEVESDGVPEEIHDEPATARDLEVPVIEESPPGGFEPTTSEPPAEESGPVPVQDEIDVDKLDEVESDGVPEEIHDEPATARDLEVPVIEESPPGGFEPTTSDPPAEDSGPVPVQEEIVVDRLVELLTQPARGAGMPPSGAPPMTEEAFAGRKQTNARARPYNLRPPSGGGSGGGGGGGGGSAPTMPTPETRTLPDPERKLHTSADQVREHVTDALAKAQKKAERHSRPAKPARRARRADRRSGTDRPSVRRRHAQVAQAHRRPGVGRGADGRVLESGPRAHDSRAPRAHARWRSGDQRVSQHPPASHRSSRSKTSGRPYETRGRWSICPAPASSTGRTRTRSSSTCATASSVVRARAWRSARSWPS